MGYTNSPLVAYTKLSPNHSGQRTHGIDRSSPHCVVGQCSIETLGEIFHPPLARHLASMALAWMAVLVCMYVEEKNRSWCTSSNANDQRAITIECASDTTHPYAMNAAKKIGELCKADMKKNGILASAVLSKNMV